MTIDFMPYWKDEEDCFLKERLEDGKTPWPREKPIEQSSYEKWLSNVKNPVADAYYEKVDKYGKRDTAHYQIREIIRVKDEEGKEFLISSGWLIGYNALGDERRHYINWPEMWTETIFDHVSVVDTNNPNNIVSSTTGPKQRITRYMMECNKENLNKLVEQKANENINLSVKDLNSDKRVDVRFIGSFKDRVKFFLDNDFWYLHNGMYISEDEKKLNRQLAERQGLAEMTAAGQK
jgi:hypothetical protein